MSSRVADPMSHAATPLLSWSEMQRSWPQRTLAEAAYQGTIELFERPPTLDAGRRRPVTFRIANNGTEHWPGLEREPRIAVSHRWLTAPSSGAGSWSATCLPASLECGASALVPVPIEAPPNAGPHTLELALVHDDPRRPQAPRRFAAIQLPVDVQGAA